MRPRFVAEVATSPSGNHLARENRLARAISPTPDAAANMTEPHYQVEPHHLVHFQVNRTPVAAGEPLWLSHSGSSSRLLWQRPP